MGAELKHFYQGQVQLFPITHLSAETTYTQTSLKIPGVLPYTSKFGIAVNLVAGKGEQALLVGAPEYSSTEGDGLVAVIPLNGVVLEPGCPASVGFRPARTTSGPR